MTLPNYDSGLDPAEDLQVTTLRKRTPDVMVTQLLVQIVNLEQANQFLTGQVNGLTARLTAAEKLISRHIQYHEDHGGMTQVSNAGVRLFLPCNDCGTMTHTEEIIRTADQTRYLELCQSCYDKRGNAVR